jgi:sugar/nucleoside kinase (ribokinase family)
MPNLRIVVIGDANVDMVIRLPDRYAQTPGNVHFNPQLHGGGSAANTAVALARLGVGVSFVGALGDDGYGRWVLEDFKREGVESSGVSLVKDAFTPMVMALIEPNGERYVAVWPEEGGAHFQLRKDDINPSAWETASWLHTTGMCLRASPACEAILYAMECAKEQGLTVSLDLNLRLESWGLDESIRTLFDRAIALSDVVMGNAAEEIMPLMGVDNVEEATIKLSDGIRIVIARQGEMDAVVTAGEEILYVPVNAVEVVDTLGAGDAFNGGFITARLEGAGIKEATEWGHVAAAYKIGRVGARNAPTKEGLKEMLRISRAKGRKN